MKNLILFINGHLGFRVLQYVTSDSDTHLLAVILNSNSKRSHEYEKKVRDYLTRKSPTTEIYKFSSNLWEQDSFILLLKKANFGVSALFGHLIPEHVIKLFRGNLFNLHPSLLPYGRGADPVAWSIIEKTPVGVSIHEIDKGIDSGKVVAQSQMQYQFSDTAGDLYEAAILKLFELFVDFYSASSSVNLTLLNDAVGTYHQTSDLENVRKSLTDGNLEIEQTLRIIQALSFNDGRSATIKLDNGETWSVRLIATKVKNGADYEKF